MKRWAYRIILGGMLAACAYYTALTIVLQEAGPAVAALIFALFALVVIGARRMHQAVETRRARRSPESATQDPLSQARLRAWNLGSETIDDLGRVQVDEAAARLHGAAALADAVTRIAEERIASSAIRASMAYRARGEFVAAAEAIDRSGRPEEIERDHSALLARGLGRLGSGDREGALEDFGRADRRLAHIAGAVESNRASAYIQEGDFQEALCAADRGISHMSRSSRTRGHWLPHVYRVSALELMGDERGAVVALQTMAESIAEPKERESAAAYLKRQALTAALRRRVNIDHVFGLKG